MTAIELRRKSDAIQAGLFLAQQDVVVNAPDVAHITTRVNYGAQYKITVASTPLSNATIIGVSSNSSRVSAVLPLSDLANSGYSLRAPIFVTLAHDVDSGEWVASFPEAEVSRSGESPAEAMDWLRVSLVDVYELYKKREKDLGPLPKRQLSALEKHLVAKSHSYSRSHVHRQEVESRDRSRRRA